MTPAHFLEYFQYTKKVIITLIGIIFVSVLTMILASYSPNDPSWAHMGSNVHDIANMGGTRGAWFSGFLLAFFGDASWLLLIFAMYETSLQWWYRHRLTFGLLRTIGYVFLFLSLCTLLSMIRSIGHVNVDNSVTGSTIDAMLSSGGIVGYEMASHSISALTPLWSWTFLILVLPPIITLIFDIRWKLVFINLVGLQWLGSGIEKEQSEIEQEAKNSAKEKFIAKRIQQQEKKEYDDELYNLTRPRSSSEKIKAFFGIKSDIQFNDDGTEYDPDKDQLIRELIAQRKQNEKDKQLPLNFDNEIVEYINDEIPETDFYQSDDVHQYTEEHFSEEYYIDDSLYSDEPYEKNHYESNHYENTDYTDEAIHPEENFQKNHSNTHNITDNNGFEQHDVSDNEQTQQQSKIRNLFNREDKTQNIVTNDDLKESKKEGLFQNILRKTGLKSDVEEDSQSPAQTLMEENIYKNNSSFQTTQNAELIDNDVYHQNPQADESVSDTLDTANGNSENQTSAEALTAKWVGGNTQANTNSPVAQSDFNSANESESEAELQQTSQSTSIDKEINSYQRPQHDDNPFVSSEPVTNNHGDGSADENNSLVKTPNIHDDDAFEGKSRAFQTAKYRSGLSDIPSLDLLDRPDPNRQPSYTDGELEQLSELLEIKLQDFNVKAEVRNIIPGPVVTRFEVELAPGIKASKVVNISRDLARSLSMASLRVVEVIPGKPYIGIEIPNKTREMVRLIELLNTDKYKDPNAMISMAMGKDIGGKPIITDLAKAPHMLVAGTTGSGKSVLVNSMLLSMLLKYTPDQLRLILIDPKQLELANYNEIPHLLTPVVTDMTEAAGALSWCVAEMERRYQLMSLLKVRKLNEFNKKVIEAEKMGNPIIDPLWRPNDSVSVKKAPKIKPLPMIVIVADEFADMIMQVGKQAEELITRLAQKSRASGIHLMLATQRPSVDVITGLIKANIPVRSALRVNSKIDSRTILDSSGAEDMLGNGDMLFLGPGQIEAERVHGAFVSDEEVNRVCEAWRERGAPEYIDNFTENFQLSGSDSGNTSSGGTSGEDDKFYSEAVAFVLESRKVSASSIQRKFSIGYNRAARIVDSMEATGIVSPMIKGKREILV